MRFDARPADPHPFASDLRSPPFEYCSNTRAHATHARTHARARAHTPFARLGARLEVCVRVHSSVCVCMRVRAWVRETKITPLRAKEGGDTAQSLPTRRRRTSRKCGDFCPGQEGSNHAPVLSKLAAGAHRAARRVPRVHVGAHRGESRDRRQVHRRRNHGAARGDSGAGAHAQRGSRPSKAASPLACVFSQSSLPPLEGDGRTVA